MEHPVELELQHVVDQIGDQSASSDDGNGAKVLVAPQQSIVSSDDEERAQPRFSRGWQGELRLFLSLSRSEARQRRCEFCLGTCSIFVVVLVATLMTALLGQMPLINLSRAEASAGQTDAIVKASQGDSGAIFLNSSVAIPAMKRTDTGIEVSPRIVRAGTAYGSSVL
ncbi:MAG: hypothetical protein MHM6MM_007960 [Cercozoa sp. M6MM]